MKAEESAEIEEQREKLAASDISFNLIKGCDEGACVSESGVVSVLLIEGSPRSH